MNSQRRIVPIDSNDLNWNYFTFEAVHYKCILTQCINSISFNKKHDGPEFERVYTTEKLGSRVKHPSNVFRCLLLQDDVIHDENGMEYSTTNIIELISRIFIKSFILSLPSLNRNLLFGYLKWINIYRKIIKFQTYPIRIILLSLFCIIHLAA